MNSQVSTKSEPLTVWCSRSTGAKHVTTVLHVKEDIMIETFILLCCCDNDRIISQAIQDGLQTLTSVAAHMFVLIDQNLNGH